MICHDRERRHAPRGGEISLVRSLGVLVTTLCCLLAVATSASAEEGQLVKMYGLGTIPVWRSPSVIDEGFSLLRAGQRELAEQRMACTVDAGTRVVGTYTGGAAYRVVVIEGKAKGCSGYVPAPMFTVQRGPKGK